MIIDVFFAGLILICLDGQPNCPVGDFGNTAWVVKADGTKSEPCGWKGYEETELVLRFSSAQFDYDPGIPDVNCKPDAIETGVLNCPLLFKDICVLPRPDPFGRVQRLDSSLQWLPRLDEVDRRFKGLDPKALANPNYVPTRIHFPKGMIGAGDRWPNKNSPIKWYRSDNSSGGALPRELSDRLKVTYDKTEKLALTDCGANNLIVLKPKTEHAEVVIQNRAIKEPVPVPEIGYDRLGYLLWYYRLGLWAESDQCPIYKQAVLLQCKRQGPNKCARIAVDNVHWPAMLGPWF